MPRSVTLRVPPALLVLLVVSLGGHFAIREWFPTERTFGDENTYARYAWLDADRGIASLLPGRLRLTHHPSLNSHVLSQLGPSTRRFGPRLQDDAPPASYALALVRDASAFYALLFTLTLLATYFAALGLGVGSGWAALAPGILLALPRVLFHVHSIWSETLHMAFEVFFFASLFTWYRRRSVWWFCVAGLWLGLAVLTRQTLLYFVPVVLCWVAWSALAGTAGGGKRRGIITLAAMAALVLGVATPVVPQVVRNRNAGMGAVLATNTWRNLEYGLRRRTDGDPPGLHTLSWKQSTKLYNRARGPRLHPDELANRELHAKRRTIAFLVPLPVGRVLHRQWQKLWPMLLRGNSQFAHAVKARRWGHRTPLLRAVAEFDRRVWPAFVLLGLASSAALMFLRGGWTLIALFLAYYVLAYGAVPINARVALQMAPALAITIVGVAAEAARRLPPLLRGRSRVAESAVGTERHPRE